MDMMDDEDEDEWMMKGEAFDKHIIKLYATRIAAFGLLAEETTRPGNFSRLEITRVRITCHFAVRKTDLRF